MGELGFYHSLDIQKEVANQLIWDITTDVGIPIWLVRLYHNKLVSYVLFSSKCYLAYFDLFQFSQFVSPILLPYLLYGLFGKKWRKMLTLLFLLFPWLFIFNLLTLDIGGKIFLYQLVYIAFSAVGFFKVLLKNKG